jgi:hypothetical protein
MWRLDVVEWYKMITSLAHKNLEEDCQKLFEDTTSTLG